LEYGEKTENKIVENGTKNAVGPGLWREKLKNVENEKRTL
jgi:hypothetical protein